MAKKITRNRTSDDPAAKMDFGGFKFELSDGKACRYEYINGTGEVKRVGNGQN